MILFITGFARSWRLSAPDQTETGVLVDYDLKSGTATVPNIWG